MNHKNRVVFRYNYVYMYTHLYSFFRIVLTAFVVSSSGDSISSISSSNKW